MQMRQNQKILQHLLTQHRSLYLPNNSPTCSPCAVKVQCQEDFVVLVYIWEKEGISDSPLHSILKCNYANEVNIDAATPPAPFTLFSQKFSQGFIVCRSCASWKGLFYFEAHLGERRGDSFLL